MTKPIVFGEIPGIKEGHYFPGRKEMMVDSFHRNWAAGIDGNGKEGTSAIVLSGGYEDDFDLGDEIVYTGAGGNDPNSGKQISHQNWENRGNAGLLHSKSEGLPVRVIRGYTHKSAFSPKTGYTYAGLFSVVDAWQEIGKSGFKICRFRLVYSGKNEVRKTSEEIELDYVAKDKTSDDLILDYVTKEKRRSESVVLRVIRDTKIANEIKNLYDFKCQVCNTALITKNGKYAEGAHIKPLGKPHDGDDNSNNLLCLCPNHHVLFDNGAFSISDDFSIIGSLSGKIFLHNKHLINKSNLQYHRSIHGY